jgi:hypothetical protein
MHRVSTAQFRAQEASWPLDSASIQAKATNDELHLLQSTRFLRGTAPLASTINEGQIANALTDVVYYPGSRPVLTNFWQRKLSWREQSVRSLDAELTAA